MKLGSTAAPTRHPLDWRNPDFTDLALIEAEMERVFDICHGCRRCFNLCESFPRLFDMIDQSPTGELDGVDEADYAKVVEACTLCDLCFMTKCPYVPPHEFNLDFPHLILRWRAASHAAGDTPQVAKELANTDRNAKLARPVAGVINWASDRANRPARAALEKLTGIDRDAELPRYHRDSFDRRVKENTPTVNHLAPAYGRKAVLYTSCIANYNQPDIATAALKLLAHQGVLTEIVYPACCGMPYLEHGDIAEVARRAEIVAEALIPYIEAGYSVLTLTASCGLMLKSEWPLISPENDNIKRLAAATRDIDHYIVELARTEGLTPGLSPVEGGISVHLACHARAQNIGQKAAEMLKLIPDTKVEVIERCSGHGGSFGVMRKTRPLAVKVGRNAVAQASRQANAQLCSDCALACKHIAQGIADSGEKPPAVRHPIEILAQAYGL